MKVLVFCAHADDEVIGMGATIRKFADAGAEIRLVHFSRGAEGYATPEEKATICDIREAEVARVCGVLGIASHVNLGHLDWSVEVGNATYRQVIAEIRAFRPDAVFTHRHGDYHDHMNVSQAVGEGWFHAPLLCAMEEDSVWKPVPLYEFEVITLFPQPELVVDVTDTFGAKLKAMEVYSSQTGVVGGAAQMLTGRALLRGQAVGVRYGEALCRSKLRPARVNEVGALLEGGDLAI